MNSEDLRAQAILTWLRDDLLLNVLEMQPASSDASFRRYFRITLPDSTWIVMDAPPESENITPFINVARLLKHAKVNVPELYHIEPQQGFIALADFGRDCILDKLTANPTEADHLYTSAFDCLINLYQQTVATQIDLPAYNEALFNRELAIFSEWFLGAYLNLEYPEPLRQTVNQFLINSALAQPQVVVHRDFHSRNLMAVDQHILGVIDFQDAVIGPITYDLVSLLKDCYISWPAQQVDAWREDFFNRLTQSQLITANSVQFKRWFDLMGLQRHLKAIGIFARLHLRDGKSSYLNDIPRTLTYVKNTCAQYPELTEFNLFLTQTILPTYQQK